MSFDEQKSAAGESRQQQYPVSVPRSYQESFEQDGSNLAYSILNIFLSLNLILETIVHLFQSIPISNPFQNN